jgi:hypothetical protein
MNALLLATLAAVLAVVVIRALGPSRTLLALGAVALFAAALVVAHGYGPELLAAVAIIGTAAAACTAVVITLLHRLVVP